MHSSRWRSLHVRVRNSGELVGLTQRAAPMLQECTLLCNAEYEDSFDIFQGGTPLLRDLKPEAFDVSWSSSVFSNLQTLSVTSWTSSQPAEKVLAALSRCPRLASLDLHLMYWDGPDEVTHLQPVVLDDLVVLKLEIFFRNVLLPLITWLRIRPSVVVCIGAARMLPTEITASLTAQLANALDGEDTRLYIFRGSWRTHMTVYSTASSTTLFQLDLEDPVSANDLLLFSKVNSHGRPITFHSEGTTIHHRHGFIGSDSLPSILSTVDLLPTLDRLVLEGWEGDQISDMINHLSHPISSSGLWSCSSLNTIEFLRCRGHVPRELLHLINIRNDGYHRDDELESTEDGRLKVEAEPSSIKKIVVGSGGFMDEGSFLEIERVIGSGNLHWCDQLSCPTKCPQCSRMP